MKATAFLTGDASSLDSQTLLLSGSELELQRSVINRMVETLLDGDDMSVENLDAQRNSTAEFLDAVATGGLFSPRRIVVFRNAEEWAVPAQSPQLAEIEKMITSPDPNTWVVIAATSYNKGRYPFKLLLKHAVEIECEPLKGAELTAWLRNYLAESGLTAADAVMGYIIDLVGNDLTMLKNTLEKISLYMDDRKRIERNDVETCVSTGREHAMWELTEAIGARNVQKALSMTDSLLNEGKHPLQIVTTLQYQFRQLIAVRSLLQRRKSPQEIKNELNIRFFLDRVLQQSKAFSPRELLDAYDRLYMLENSLKSAISDERFVLEKSLYEICTASR